MDIRKEIASLPNLTVVQLQERYAEVFGEETRSYHRDYLVRRIAWRLQANAEGGLSERARQRAREIANEADLRSTPPRAAKPQVVTAPVRKTSRGRLPMPGTVLSREYKGQQVQVLVLPDGNFEYEGEVYRSLSAIAKAVTGTQWNGYLFFGLAGKAVKA